MNSAISCQIESVGHLLRSQGTLLVPPYQRNYSWEKEHVFDLWSDITQIIINEESDYCLGSIVIDNSAAPNLTLIDGQQRLTTISIMLSALRMHLQEQNLDKLASEIETNYIVLANRGAMNVKPQLQLNLTNSPFYDTYIFVPRPLKEITRLINDDSCKQSNRLLAECYLYLYSQIGQITDPDKGQFSLKQFSQLLTHALEETVILIRIDVENDDKAFTLFESLNNRGVELSESDLLKNHLFAKAGEKLPLIKTNWDLAAQNLGQISVVRYIRHYWLSNHGVIPSLGLYSAFKRRITNAQEAQTLSQGLYDSSEPYSALFDPDHCYWEEFSHQERSQIQDDLKSINLFRTDTCHILLLATLDHAKDEFADILSMIVNFTFRYSTICGQNPARLQRAYMAASAFIRSENKITAKIIFSRFLQPLYPTDAQFQSAFSRKTIKNTPIARYILARINDGLIEHTSIKTETNPNTTDLEHILPKKYHDSWCQEVSSFPGGPAKYVNRLGNMTLISSALNRNLGNADFLTKKKIYKNDCLNITNGILEENKWAAQEINQRQNWLATQAVKIWNHRQ